MDYCYTCGHLGHAVRDCKAIQDDETDQGEDDHNYGPWLRASPMKKPTSITEGKRNLEVQQQLVFKLVTGTPPTGGKKPEVRQPLNTGLQTKTYDGIEADGGMQRKRVFKPVVRTPPTGGKKPEIGPPSDTGPQT